MLFEPNSFSALRRVRAHPKLRKFMSLCWNIEKAAESFCLSLLLGSWIGLKYRVRAWVREARLTIWSLSGVGFGGGGRWSWGSGLRDQQLRKGRRGAGGRLGFFKV